MQDRDGFHDEDREHREQQYAASSRVSQELPHGRERAEIETRRIGRVSAMQERLDHETRSHRRDGIRRSDGQRAHCTREPRSDQEQRGHGLQFVGRAEFQPRRRLEVWRRGGEKIGEMDFCR